MPTTVIDEKFGTTVGTIISKARHDLMKVVWIWVTALILSAVPVGLLARRNRPSVLTGVLVVALFVVFALGGLGLGGAGAGPTSDLAGLLILWIVVMAVWAVVTPTVHVTWLSYSFYGERLHQRVNNLLRERGYPVKIALGFASSTAIDSAGGDDAYFGRDGSRVIPQYLPDNVIGNHPRRLEPPRRKG